MSHAPEILEIIKKLDESIQTTLKSNSKWYNKVSTLVELIVPEIEEISNKGSAILQMSGEEKKSLATEIILDLYFRYLNSKYIPDWIERMIVSKISSTAIDAFVKLMNKKGLFKHFAKVGT